MRILKRDPFGRRSLISETVPAVNGMMGYARTCGWCGASRSRFMRYKWQNDSGRDADWSRPFCGVSCYRAFSGE